MVEGLVQSRERSVVTTTGSDVVDFSSYLPIYHNESRVFFQQKYVSLFITLDNVAYVVPANSPGVYRLHKLIVPPPYRRGALGDTAIRPSVCPMAQLPRL